MESEICLCLQRNVKPKLSISDSQIKVFFLLLKINRYLVKLYLNPLSFAWFYSLLQSENTDRTRILKHILKLADIQKHRSNFRIFSKILSKLYSAIIMNNSYCCWSRCLTVTLRRVSYVVTSLEKKKYFSSGPESTIF